MQAEAHISGGAVNVELSELSEVEFPQAVIQYAARTRAPVILDDASADDTLSADDYVRRHHARSILGLPLVKQGKLVALLYLENHLTPRAFTQTAWPYWNWWHRKLRFRWRMRDCTQNLWRRTATGSAPKMT